MPSKLPEGVQIQVSRRSLPADYEMPTMAMSVDHYSVGFLVSGDRRTITPQQTYDAHAGDVTVMPPYLYHRTISLSSAPYESYLIKFTQQAVEPLVRTTAPGFLEDMMERKIHHFPESARARIAFVFAVSFFFKDFGPPPEWKCRNRGASRSACRPAAPSH